MQYPRVILVSGNQLAIEPQFRQVKVQTPYGSLDLPLTVLQSIILRDDASGQPAVRLRDGSRFEGFLRTEQLSVKLRQERSQQLSVETIVALQFGAAIETPPQEPYVTMANGDVLCGSPADDPLRVASTFGRMNVPRAQVATIAAVPDAPLLLEINMLDGSRLKVRLHDDQLPFILSGGQRVVLPAGHLRELKLRPVRTREENMVTEDEIAETGESAAVAGEAGVIDRGRLAADLVIYESFDSSVRSAHRLRRMNFPAGRYGQALAIPRGNRLAYRVPPDFLTAATVMCNVRVDTDSGRTMFWSFDNNYPSAFNYPDHEYRLCMHFLIGDRVASATLAQRMEPGRWYHLAQSWGANGFRAYLDGALAFQDMRQCTGVTLNPAPVSHARLYLGNSAGPAPELGPAAYDDFAVFRRQLSDGEVLRLACEPQLLHGLLPTRSVLTVTYLEREPGRMVITDEVGVPALPLGRDQQSVVAVAGALYVAGGYHTPGAGETGCYVNDLLRWSPGEDRWRRLTDLPLPRTCHAAAAVGNSIYLMGGGTEVGSTHPYSDLDDVARYDLDSGCWTTCAPMPTPRNFLCATACNGKIYAIGGSSHGVSAYGTFECYDPARDVWTGLVPMPTPRYAAAAATVGGKIYVFGGAGADMRSGVAGHRRNLYFNILEILDPSTGRWTRGADMPTPRSGAVTGVIGGRIYVMGGFDDKDGYGHARRNPSGNSPDAGELAVLNVVESYDPATNTWRREPSLRQPSNRGGAAVLGDVIYLVGGCTIDGTSYDRVEVYRPQ